ncbi:MATE family efflux transporter [bacterium]|nr:MATE family efflux transporter [bacterium]
MQQKQILDDENVGRLLFKLSVPAIVGMFVMALYNIVDTIFVGKGVGTMAIGALSIAFPLQMITMGFSQMIGIGAASLLSRSLGEGNIDKAGKIIGNALAIAVCSGLVLSGLGLIFIEQILSLFGATDTLAPVAEKYISVILIGLVFQALSMTMNNMVRAEGRARVAMMTMIIGAVGNIILDALFILKFHWGVAGAAWATVISQSITTAFLIHFFYSGRAIVRPRWVHWRLDKGILHSIFSVGIATFARHSAMSILSMIMNRTLANFGGDMAIAVYGILFRVLMFVFMPMMGIAQGMQPIVGFNYGAGRFDRLRHTVRLAMIISSAFSIIGTLILSLFPKPIFNLFSNDITLINMGRQALHWVIRAFPLVGFQVVAATMFQAIGKVVPNFILSLSRQIFFLIPLILILPRYYQLTGVWMAFPVSDILSAILTTIFLLRIRKELQDPS